MIRFAIINRMIKSFLAEMQSIGGTTQNRFISPKGLFSKPKKENAIIINLSNGNNQDVILALQKDIELEDGDVYVTDDKSFLHFHFKDGNITLKTKKLICDVDQFELNAQKFDINNCDTNFNNGSVKHNNTTIDDTHTHSQNADSAGNTQAETNTPS